MLVVFLYILLGIVFVATIAVEVKKATTWNLSVWVQFWLLVYYIVIPIIMQVTTIQNGGPAGIWEDAVVLNVSYTNLQTFLATLLFLFSFWMALSLKFGNLGVKSNVLNVGGIKVPVLHIGIAGAFIISVISLFIYSTPFGGLAKLLKIAPYVNSPYFEGKYAALHSGPHTMFKRFIALSIYPILFAGFYRKKWSIPLWILPSLAVFIYYMLVERQRQLTVLLFIIPILGYQVYKGKFVSPKFVFWTGIAIVAFPLITFLNKAFIYNASEFKSVMSWVDFDKYMKEFNFPHISIYFAQSMEYNKFWFQDFYSGLFGNYLPSSWYAPDTVNSVNSYFFKGEISKSVPPGIVAQGFYHLGWFGVMLWGLFFGFIVNVFDSFFASLIKFDKRYAFAYIYTFAAFFALIRTGVLGYSLYRPFVAAFMLILLLSHTFYSKSKNGSNG